MQSTPESSAAVAVCGRGEGRMEKPARGKEGDNGLCPDLRRTSLGNPVNGERGATQI